MITISLVSHGHGEMVANLIDKLLQYDSVAQIILTRNVPEAIRPPVNERVKLIENTAPKGFGINHNAAFQLCRQPYFCVLNPDIDLPVDPFPALIRSLEEQNAALVVPRVLTSDGHIEDSIRHFPTIRSLVSKALSSKEGRYPYPPDSTLIFPDWVAGMFMLFRASDFAAVHGFDQRYFLYYEDVDICARLHAAGKIIVANLSVKVIHNAQRASRKSLRHMRWHLVSMIRYLWRYRRGIVKSGA